MYVCNVLVIAIVSALVIIVFCDVTVFMQCVVVCVTFSSFIFIPLYYIHSSILLSFYTKNL
jgi:hypothetical protein